MGFCHTQRKLILIAYLDEFGHIGPYVSETDGKYNQHPVFGYAGFVLPASHSRNFGSTFSRLKNQLFKTEIEKSKNPHQWERKGNEFFSTGSIQSHPEQVSVFNDLMNSLTSRNGKIFYYGEEKPIGTLKQTKQSSTERTNTALREAINRLCTHAHSNGDEILIIMDQINEKSRVEMVAKMYAHVYGRSTDYSAHPEMRRIVDAPLHIESKLNSSIQFADWICALISRLSHWQMVPNSQFDWAAEKFDDSLRNNFTSDSKIYIPNGVHIHNSALLNRGASRYPVNSVGSRLGFPPGFLETLHK